MTDTAKQAPRPEWLDRAEEAKLLAEAEEVAAKANLHRAEASKHNVEAEKLAAEARVSHAIATESEARAAKAGIELDRENYKRAKELAGNEHHHRYPFIGAVDNASAIKCMDQLDFWDRTEQPTELEIAFWSPGGGVFAGMALFDHILAMRAKGWKVTTTSRGYAASMGGILVQAGDIRAMGRESFLHIHEVATGAIGKTSDIEDEVTLMKKMESRVIDIFASRSKLSKATIRAKMKRREWWLDSTEALKLGLVDQIV